MAEGFIVINRKITDWKWWKNSTAVHLWMYILFAANWKDGYDMSGNLIERGSFIRSLNTIAEDTNLSVSTVRRWLAKFQESGEIRIEKIGYYQKIIVVKYREYQDYEHEDEHNLEHKGEHNPEHNCEHNPEHNCEHGYNKNNKNNKNNKETSIVAQSDKNHSEPTADVDPIPLVDGTEFFPTVSDFEQWVKAYPAVDVRTEISKMRAWCLANPKNRKTRNGAQRFIVNWLSKSQNSAPRLKEIPKEIVPDYITKQLEDEKKEEEHLW